jgi:hypothetical protein
MSDLIAIARRRYLNFCRDHPYRPTELRLDPAAYEALAREVEEQCPTLDVRAPVVGLTHVFGMRLVVVDEPEWMEAR